MEQNMIKDIAATKATKENLQGMRNKIEKTVEEIKSSMVDSFGIDEILAKYTQEEVAKMSYSQAKEIFVDTEGNFVFNEEEFTKDMIMDFIKYLKMSQATFAKLDEEFVNMDAAMAEFNKEVEKTVAGYGSLNKTMVYELQKQIDSEDTPDELKERAKAMMVALDNAKTLAPLFKLYETLSVQNTLRDLKDEQTRINTLKAYSRVCKAAGMEPKLLKMGGFEAILGEKYEEHKNLFIFIIARYVKHLDRKLVQPENKTFIIQLTNYLREMILGEETDQYKADKEELEILKANICLLLDKFYN